MDMDRLLNGSSSSGHSRDSTDETLNDSNDRQEQRKNFNGWRQDTRLWIPSRHPNRTIALCFDGTGDEFDADNSNIVQMVSMLKKDDTSQQLVYYQAGIGTYTNPMFVAPPMKALYEVLDEMFALNLSTHIKEGYAFLMQNYTYGDKICIFGFSRGAYTARALAGMLQKIGLLPMYNYQQIQFAYDMYKRVDKEGLEESETFKRTFCRDVHVDFLGVWDTVASVGLIPKYLPFVTENNGIRYLRHALSLDERRVKFFPTFCVDPLKKTITQAVVSAVTAGKMTATKAPEKEFEDRMNDKQPATNVLEVWFAGVHTDVGGGSVRNDTPHALARIPLRWMIRECFRCNTGLMFDAVMLQQIGLNITYGPDHSPVLGDPPRDRLPGNSPLTEGEVDVDQSRASFCSAAFRVLWTTITSPFVRLLSIFSNVRTKQGRSVISARRLGGEYTLNKQHENYEAEAELNDARSRMYDQLKAHWWWNILEYVPVRIKKQHAIVQEIENLTAFEWIWNRGRGRRVCKSEMQEGMKVHRSVKTRLEAGAIFEGQKYVPQVRPHIAPDGKKMKPVRLEHSQWNVDNPQLWEWVD